MKSRARPQLREREIEILNALGEASLAGIEWCRPMDIGARDGSHHSHTLRKLAKYGLVERRRRVHASAVRGSFKYRASDAVIDIVRRRQVADLMRLLIEAYFPTKGQP